MTGDEIERLEAELARLSGPARALPLLRLGQQYQRRWWLNGAGSAAALPYLEKAIAAAEEGYGDFDPQDPMRFAAGLLGWLLSARYGVHNGPADDAQRAVDLLEKSLAGETAAPMQRAMSQVMLGQVHLNRALRDFQGIDPMTILRSGAPPLIADGADRAIQCFRDVIATAPSPQMISHAQMLLTAAEAFQPMMRRSSSGGLGIDIGAMIGALSKLEDLRRSSFGSMGSGFFWPDEWLAQTDPLDWPTAFMTGEAPTEEFQPQQRIPVTVDPDAMRRDLLKLLGDGDGGVRESVVQLLRSAEPPEWIDEFVALAFGITHCAKPVTGTDNFLLAAALHLRGRRDAAGQSEDDPPVADAAAAAASLIAAADTMLADDPDGIPAMLFLATFMPDGTMDDIAARLTGLSATLRAIEAKALVFPEPADALRWNAMAGRLEPAGGAGMPDPVVVVGQDPPASGGDDLIVSYVASLAQLETLSGRTVRPVTERPVFLASPRGDREWAAVEAMLLRRTSYPSSRGLGQLIENADGRGTAAEVLAAAQDASLLQVGCGITTSGAFELADGTELSFTGVTGIRGGLVVLPPGQFLPLADVLLAAGFTGVIGWCRPVPEVTAALAVFVLHLELVDHGRTPAAAVREVRRWLRQPDRAILPSLLAGRVDELDHASATDWTSLAYRGR